MSKMILIDEAKLSSVLEAIEMLVRFESDSWELGSCRIAGRAVSALREALAEQPAQQEPVAYAEQSILDWLTSDARGPTAYAKTTLAKRKDGKAQAPLYTSPPAQRTLVGLTVEEIEDCYGGEINDFARAIKAKLEENNT